MNDYTELQYQLTDLTEEIRWDCIMQRWDAAQKHLLELTIVVLKLGTAIDNLKVAVLD